MGAQRDDPGSHPSSDPSSDPSSVPGSDPGSDPSSDPGSDPGFIFSLSHKPSVITVSTASLLVNFKAWSSSRDFQDTRSNGATIILEPCFVKKVKYFNHFFSTRNFGAKI